MGVQFCHMLENVEGNFKTKCTNCPAAISPSSNQVRIYFIFVIVDIILFIFEVVTLFAFKYMWFLEYLYLYWTTETYL